MSYVDSVQLAREHGCLSSRQLKALVRKERV